MSRQSLIELLGQFGDSYSGRRTKPLSQISRLNIKSFCIWLFTEVRERHSRKDQSVTLVTEQGRRWVSSEVNV
jgi:hypothetical protein